MINVTSQILKFRDFLVHSWSDLDRLMENHDWDDDGDFTHEWVQVNWEFLVERELLEKKGFLKSYIFDDYRVTWSGMAPTHEIICKSKSRNELVADQTQLSIPLDTKLQFGGFVTRRNPGYGWYPPFDYITVFTPKKKRMYELAVNDVDFFLCQISEQSFN